MRWTLIIVLAFATTEAAHDMAKEFAAVRMEMAETRFSM